MKIVSDEFYERIGVVKCKISYYRIFEFEYKGGKPTFKVDGNLSYLIFPSHYGYNDSDKVLLFAVGIKREMERIMKPILDEYKELYWDGFTYMHCRVEDIDEEFVLDRKLMFKGSCEIEISEAYLYFRKPGSRSFSIVLEAKNVTFEKLIWNDDYCKRFGFSK